ncbi:MAG: hypothetical protein L0241_29795 [Planctomycetia bacterium]|nr:hypothetical protein [Planctomycetia bacterium]
MPISVVCPGCKSKLSAPDAAAGKRVKCPKPGCGSIIAVPAFVAVEEAEAQEPPPPPPPKPKVKAIAVPFDFDQGQQPKSAQKKPAAMDLDDDEQEDEPKPKKKVRAVVEDDDDDERPTKKKKRRDEDDDDDDDRPTKKKKKGKKKAAGISPVLIVGIAVGALLVLGGVGYGVYALAIKKKDDTANTGGGGTPAKAAVPTGWVEHTSEKDKFKAYFPKQPLIGPDAPPGGFPGAKPKSVTAYAVGGPADDFRIILFVAQMQSGATPADIESVAEVFNQGWRGAANSKEGTATWASRPAKEFVVEKKNIKGPSSGILVRQMSTDAAVYGVAIFNRNGPVPSDVINGFFDNFELLN